MALVGALIGAGSETLAEDPTVLWAKTASLYASGGVALSPTGDFLVAGEGDPYPNAFVSKFDSEGSQVASNAFFGAEVNALAVDQAGAIYLTGWIGTNGSFNYPTEQGLFVAKYDQNFNRIWVSTESQQPPGTVHRSYANRLVLDVQGNVYVAGASQGPTTLGSTAFSDSTGSRPLFCKYDGSGQLLWARRIDFTPSATLDGGEVYDLAVDSSGNVVISGFLREGTADFGGTIVYPGSTGHSYDGDWFLAKYNPSGDALWVQLGYTVGAVNLSSEIYAKYDWAVDGYSGIAKLSPQGGLVWSKIFPANLYSPKGMTLDPAGQPVFTGSFVNTVSVDGIALQSRSGGWADFYVAKANTEGTIQWAISGGGTDNNSGDSVLCDPHGNSYFQGMVGEDGSFGGFPITPGIVVAKIAASPSLKIASATGGVSISWPIGATNYVLEATTSLSTTSWDTVTNTPAVSATECSLQLPLTGNAKFFRLRKP